MPRRADQPTARGRALAAAALALLLAACEEKAPAPPPPRTARVIEVEPAELPLSGEGSGTVASRNTTSVGFLVGGRLISRDVDVGDTVKAGDARRQARPDRPPEPARPRRRPGRRGAGRRDAGGAARKRRSASSSRTASPPSPNTTRRSRRCRRAQADLASAQANAEARRRTSSNYATLNAPVAGAVTQTGADPGQVVQAGQMIVEIAQTDQLDAVFSVPAQVANLAKIGMPVTVCAPGRTRPSRSRGRSARSSPDADPVTGTYTVKVALDRSAAADAARRAGPRPVPSRPGDDADQLPPTALVQTGDTAAGLGGRRRRHGHRRRR